MTGRLEGKVALVTGGASGIGRACAVRFAVEGADVAIGDVDVDRAKQTMAAVEAVGRRVVISPCDTSREDDCEQLAATCVDELGRLDVVLAAAGISHAGYVSGQPAGAGIAGALQSWLDRPLSEWQRVLDVNLTGVMLTNRAAARQMIQLRNGGSIVNIASLAAKITGGGASPYSVSKTGVWMLTKSLAIELAPHKIRVNAIGPGFIETPMTEAMLGNDGFAQNVLRRTPLGRFGEPRDIANTALFLASDDASFITGSILFPDGGYDAGGR